ncbi:fimbria/pilus periplasmic chaperone [Serratia ficaria]|uniref:fimbria/pilus periplasmic chaperone n=1 Tax=Serratia ficaria TaxID=61651 RepID=UPI0021780D7F|nr:fimbria/pilus periplasmic chaperone [Serratia ficaria]CAI1507007.1 Capsule protein fraction 1 [Serratia ficaria]
MSTVFFRKESLHRNILTACFFLFPAMVLATQPATETSTQSFSVRLGASRIIYNPASAGQTLAVTNPQDYPILIQSKVLDTDRKTPAPFVVTPPLMRLDAQQSSRLRIVRTGGDFAPDRESMQLLCVKGIPPKEGDAWAKEKGAASEKVSLNVQLSINNCIKLLVRPDAVKGHPDDAQHRLKWQRQNNKLKATNDSPFYINLSALKINGANVPDIKYVAPYSSQEFTVPSGKSAGRVEWKLVNDYGGETPFYQADVR